MFSRQHYEAIAEVLKDVKEKSMNDTAQGNAHLQVIHTTIREMGEMFSKDNPNFKRAPFLTACNYFS